MPGLYILAGLILLLFCLQVRSVYVPCGIILYIIKKILERKGVDFMTWQEVQKKVIESLNSEQKKWLKSKVNLEVDNLKKYTTEEIYKIFPGRPKVNAQGVKVSTVNDSSFIYTFIWQCWLMIIAHELMAMKGNLRSFWYKELRPIFKKHNLLDKDEGPPVRSRYRSESPREIYILDRMSKIFDQFVLRGFFKFKDEFEFQDPREAFRIIGRKNPRFVFFTEKEGLFWFCEKVAKELGITAIASHGEPGLLTMEYFSEELKKRKVKNIVLACLTDYDPWGYNIAQSFKEKLEEPVFDFKVKFTNLTVLKEIFEPEVVEEKKRDLSNVSESKKKQVKVWMDETGGIDGKPYGMHIDNANFEKVWKAIEKWYKENKRKG